MIFTAIDKTLTFRTYKEVILSYALITLSNTFIKMTNQIRIRFKKSVAWSSGSAYHSYGDP